MNLGTPRYEPEIFASTVTRYYYFILRLRARDGKHLERFSNLRKSLSLYRLWFRSKPPICSMLKMAIIVPFKSGKPEEICLSTAGARRICG